MDAGVGCIFIVLDVALNGPVRVNGEDVAVAGVIVEGVSVDIVWWLLRRQDEDSSGVGVCLGCGRWKGIGCERTSLLRNGASGSSRARTMTS